MLLIGSAVLFYRIKAEKEQQRTEEERRIERLQNLEEERMEMAHREHRTLQELRMTDMEKTQAAEAKLNERKDKETTRYAQHANIISCRRPSN